MNKIIPILHNVRSLHNVGSILRTADGLGLDEVWVSGYTPYPEIENDDRLPHVAKRATTQIAKTSLGAQKSVTVRHFPRVEDAVCQARKMKFKILALEQDRKAENLTTYRLGSNCVLLLGNEVDGLDSDVLSSVETILEIPMHGQKESFNVSVAGAIAMFNLLNIK